MNKVAAATSIVATLAIGYAVFFDYRRRSSPEFRKSLKKKALKQEKQAKQHANETRKSRINNVRSDLENELAKNPIPLDPKEAESYFMQQLAMAEQVALTDATQAALCLYKALTLYPNPTDILAIYQQTFPEDIYELVVMMIAAKPPATISAALGKEKMGNGSV